MKVADSSFIAEALLRRKELFEAEDALVTLDLALHETCNTIWKHQCLLKDLDDGAPYIAILYGLIESGRIRVLHPGPELMERAYSLAVKKMLPIYDVLFVALAQEMGLKLATFDQRQADLLK